ncbi:MAG: AAA family ATPase [Gammaproteobacteria bacterium]
MYEDWFGFARPPFRITPDPELFFTGGNRGPVLEALVYAVTRGEGMVKVVGEVGSGKTMLCRMLERALPHDCDIVYLANPNLGPHEVLHAIANELGIAPAPDAGRLPVMQALQQHLLARHAEGRRVVMFVEEAQAMPRDTLEEMRLLSNLETTREKLLQIVLFGQPELDARLDDHAIRQLRERITHSFELAPLARSEIAAYVETRLAACGYRGHALFARGALAALARHSHGLLRRINVLADKALLAAFADQDRVVRAVHVRRAVRDSEFARGRRAPGWWPASPLRRAAGLLLAALLTGVVALGILRGGGWEFLPRAPLGPPAPPVAPVPPSEPTMLDAVPPRVPELPAAAHPVPRVDAASGLVDDAHLAPRLPPPPTRETPGGDQDSS